MTSADPSSGFVPLNNQVDGGKRDLRGGSVPVVVVVVKVATGVEGPEDWLSSSLSFLRGASDEATSSSVAVGREVADGWAGDGGSDRFVELDAPDSIVVDGDGKA